MIQAHTPHVTGMSLPLYRWRFGLVEYNEARRELRVAGLVVEVENRPLDVLSLLLRHAGQVVTKQQLFDQVWAGRITVDHVLATAVGKLRKALDAAGESRIVTVPRLGYRFDGPVERSAAGGLDSYQLALKPGQPVPGRPRMLLEQQLGRTLGSEVWLARHPRSGQLRVFKFALDSDCVAAIKREATLSRVLRDSLGERPDLVRVTDWNFESAPFFLECEYGGQAMPAWAATALERLDRAARIDLFLQVADVVDAAHGVGVLHRDLKPSNILLSARADGWQVRLTDFGSSRLLQPEQLAAPDISLLGFTQPDQTADSAGTLLYLAPELLAGHASTVRSDLYALGLLLYQLLVGDLQRPLAPGWEREVGDPLLCEDIALATDTDPARRLATAGELATRLRSLQARRAALAERQAAERATAALHRSLDRAQARRPWMIAAVAVLACGAAACAGLWYRSEHQRQAALRQAARAEAVVRFLSDDLIGGLSPGGGGFERNPSIRDMLQYASEHLDARFGDDPATRGSVEAALGSAWRTLGQYDRATFHLRRAVAEDTRAFGADDPLTLKTRYSLVRSLAYAGSADAFQEAARLIGATDRAAAAHLQAEDEVALYAAIARGQFHFQQLQIAPALQAFAQADRLQRRWRPQDGQMAGVIRASIADATLRQGKVQQGIGQLKALLADPLLAPARIGEATVAGYQATLARALRNDARYAQALPLAQQAVATSARVLGQDDYLTLTRLSIVASIQDRAGDCAGSLATMRTVRARMAARYGADRQFTLVETGNLGLKEYDCGDRAAGLAYLQQAERELRARYGQGNVAAHSFRYALAGALADQGRYRQALDMVDGLDLAALVAGDSSPAWSDRISALRGRVLVLSGQVEPGRALLRQALPRLATSGTEPADQLRRLQALAGLEPQPAAPAPTPATLIAGQQRPTP